MRLITIFELATKTERELQVLFRETALEVTRTAEGSTERSHAQATLENIAIARRLRRAPQP